MGLEYVVEKLFDKNNPNKVDRWKNPKQAAINASVKEGEMDVIKLKNHIEHVKDLIRSAPAEDKVKLRETVKLLQARLKRAQGGKIDEAWDEKTWSEIDGVREQMRNAKGAEHVKHRRKLQDLIHRLRGSPVKESVEDADHHLQRAHDSLGSAILKAKKTGKDVSKLEKLRAELTNHLKSLSSKD